jgi:hypothetical protein
MVKASLQSRVTQVKCDGAGVGRRCAITEGRFEISDREERRSGESARLANIKRAVTSDE